MCWIDYALFGAGLLLGLVVLLALVLPLIPR